MATRTQRTTRTTINTSIMTRHDVIMDTQTWLRDVATGMSGNAQKNIIDAVVATIGDDLRNDDWASVESHTYENTWEALCYLWAAEDGEFVGLDGKTFNTFTAIIDDKVIDTLFKLNPDVEVLGYERVNAYATKVSFSVAGKAFWMTFKSIKGKASEGFAYAPPSVYVKKGHECEAVTSAISDVRDTFHVCTSGEGWRNR